MRVWDAIASQTKPVRVYETPFIADVRLIAEAAHPPRRGLALRRAGRPPRVDGGLRRPVLCPELLEVVNLPAWDCLPYDRVSPRPGVAALRCAALARLASPRMWDPRPRWW